MQVPAEGLLSKAYAKERAALIDPKKASTSFIAGDPLKYDSKVKQWTVLEGQRRASAPTAARSRSAAWRRTDWTPPACSKDTTHMAVIDKDGNIFDVTPSGGWVPGAVILGDTGIGMSVRGEQFWLDKTRANQIRPRARPRYTLTPSLVFKGDTPMMALGTPGGDNQDQTILQAFLSMVEFWDDWYPNLHAALERPRVQTLHFYGSFWPHTAGLQQAERRGGGSRCGLQRAEGARPRREPPAPVRHVGLRDGGDDRSGDGEPLRRRRSAARLLRDRLLTPDPSHA